MPKLITPQITPDNAQTPEVTSLQRKVVTAVQNLCQQINANPFTKDSAPDDLDMGHHRISNLQDPSSEKDAVNLGFLKRAFKTGSPPVGNGGGGPQFYQIIFDTAGDISVGQFIAPPYPVGQARAGTPLEANICALTPPTGADINVNFLLVHGTATTTMLNSDLVLGTGVTTISTSSDWAVTNLQYLDQVILICNQIGSIDPGSLVSIGLVVRKA